MAIELDHSRDPAPGAGAGATLILQRIGAGDRSAANELLPIVYAELRATAGSYFRQERADHTLQPTALVHEAFAKLVQASASDWESEAHFRAVASIAMRQILHDHARAKLAAKRGGGAHAVSVTHIEAPSAGGETVDLVELDDALGKLREINEREAEIVEMRFFGGLTVPQIARLLDVSVPTVERSWRRSRAWLRSELRAAGAAGVAGPADGGTRAEPPA